MIEQKLDMQLVNEILAGSEDAYLELVNRYSSKVFNLAFRLTRHQQDAEEVVQDVFVTLYKKLARFEGKSAFSSWLYRITFNTALMAVRKRKQHPTISMEDIAVQVQESWAGKSAEHSDVNYMSTRHEMREVLEQAVAKLPLEYRSIFLLRDVDGLSNEEVAKVLGVSVPAIKSRLHRARLMLRKRLNRFYTDYVREDHISFGPRANMCEALAA
jgi:RNA polymerase sigma-70 factor (ECF subfamily)